MQWRIGVAEIVAYQISPVPSLEISFLIQHLMESLCLSAYLASAMKSKLLTLCHTL